MKKRTVALVFLGLVLGLVLASLAALRTPWAGEKVCGVAAARVEAATGLRFSFRSCRLDVLGLEVEAEGVVLGDPAAPVFAAAAVSARLAAVQALGRQIHLERLRLVRPRLTVASASPGAVHAACPPAFLARFDVRRLEVEDGSLDLALPGLRARVDGIEVRSSPASRTLRALAQPGRRTQLELATGPARLELPGRVLAAGRVAVSAEVAQDLSVAEIARAEAEVEGVRLGLSGRVEALCAPRLDVTVTAEGPVETLLALAGVRTRVPAQGSAAVAAHVKGRPAAPALSGTVRLRGVRVGQFTPGDAEAAVRLEGDKLVVERLAVPVQGGELVARGTVRLARGLPVSAQADLSGVDLAEVLDRLGVRDPWVTLRLDGKASVEGTLWPPQLAGNVEAGLRNLKALTRSYRLGAGDPGVVAFDRARLTSAIRVDAQGLSFEDARLSAGRGTLVADAAVRFSRAGGFWVRVRGDADLGVLRRVSTIPWSGLATVELSVAAAPYGNPTVAGRARVAGFRFLDLELGAASADVRYQDFLLHLGGVEGAQAGTRYRGEAVVDLHAKPVQVISARYQAHGRLRELCDAVVDRLPRARSLRDAMDAEVEVAGTLHGPAAALDADFDAQLGAGTLLGRRFDAGRVAGRIRALAEVRFDRAELRRGAGVLRGTGTWGFAPPFPWNLELGFAGVPLDGLELSADDWAGTVSGTATLDGSYAHPRAKLSATAEKVALRAVALGTVRAEGVLADGRLRVRADGGGLALSGEASLEGRMPFQARATLSLDDAARLLPGGAPAGLRVSASGEVSASGDLLDWREARVDATLSRLAASYADLWIRATAPAHLTAAHGRWELSPLTLEGPNTGLTVAGARLPGGVLDASASGTFDLRLLAGVVPSLRRAAGQLAVEAHLSGTLEAPLLVGAGRVVDAAFQLKGGSASFTEVSGALAFSQNRVIFDRLDATLNGGRATFKGEVELERLVPVRLRAEGVLDQVPLAVPAYLPATLSGRVEAVGTPASTTVSGRLHVDRARYAGELDLDSSLLAHRPAPPPAYDRAGEWIRFDVQLAVDGDVRLDTALVRGPLSGELTLTGTLAAPGLVGSLAMGRGGQAVFRGNTFDLTHAVLDFTDRSRIEVGMDVHGESQVRDYQVFLHVFGTLAQPKVKLTSSPDLPEQDIVTLLSLGFTRRDAGSQASVSGVATATAAQALLSASGLDEQVRRFLPRGGPIRDLSMRITTAYSDETGQVEPRAEFESWLLRDRLRLRFQTPLGAGRGRKAQAEVKLSAHTSVQYQWDDEDPVVVAGDHGVDFKLRWEWTDER